MSTHINFHLDDSAQFVADCSDKETDYGLVEMRRVDVEMTKRGRETVATYYKTREQVRNHITALVQLLNEWPTPDATATLDLTYEGADIATEEAVAIL